MVRWLAGALGAWVWLGCSASPVRHVERVAAPGEPVVTVAFQDNLGWPYQLERVRISLDGVTLLDREVDDGDRPAYEIGPVDAVAGEHTLVVEAITSFSSTRADRGDCAMRLRAAESFHLYRAPATVAIDLNLRGVTTSFAERAFLAFDTRGARSLRGQVHAGAERVRGAAAACRDDAPLPFSDDDIARQGAVAPWFP